MASFHYLDDPKQDNGSITTPLRVPPAHADYGRPVPSSGDDAGKLLESGQTLYRYKRLIILSAVLGVVIGLAVAIPQKPIYRAQVTLEIQDPNENFLSRGLGNTPSANNDAAETYFQTQIRLLRSESLLQRVATRLHLRDRSRGAQKSKWRQWLGISQMPLIPESDRLIQQLGENLTVRVSGLTRVVEVLYTSPDPALAADVANTLVAEFIDQSQEVRWKSAQHAGEWLTRQLAEMRVKLERSDAQLQSMARSTGLVLESGKESIEEAKLRSLEDELSKAKAESMSRQSKLELASRVEVESLPDVLDDPTIRDYNIKLTDLRRQLAEQSSTLTPAHYKIVQLQEQVTEVRTALDKARQNLLRRIRNEYEASQRNADLLQVACAEQLKLVAQASHKAVEYNMLKHEVDTSRQLYEILLQRVKEAGVASAMRASNILVVDPARRPVRPFKPNIPFDAAVGFAGGLFIGIGFVFFREQASRPVREPGELSMELDLPDLGAIPDVRQPLRLHGDKRALEGTKDLSLIRHSSDHMIDVAASSRVSPIAESFRATLPSILFGQPNSRRPRVIVVASPNAGEGKTTVSINLATAIAEITGRVLVIDGDLRKQQLHQMFKVPNEFGLSNLLKHSEPLTAGSIKEAVQSAGSNGLFVMTGGTASNEVSSLFYSRRLPEVMRLVRQEFDTVVIDSPPLLQLPDARLLARFADGAILVMRAGKTARESAIVARQRLSEDGSTVLGTILNSWDASKMGRYAYGYAK